MTASSSWRLHGLLVRCEGVELPARRASGGDADPDVDITLGHSRRVLARGEQPEGEVLGAVDLGPFGALTVVRADAGTSEERFEAYFHDLAVAVIDPTCSQISLSLSSGREDLAAVLIAGTLISLVLVLRGHPVLHASSVDVDTATGRAALAFVGSSGMGKSTLATLLCRDGALLLGDDVLRTDLRDDGSVQAWSGATATRLRDKARTLGDDAASRVETTADGRASAYLTPSASESLPLRALVVPRPEREVRRLEVTPISGAEAVLTLARHPRLLGWTDPATSAQALRHWGGLVRRVPLLVAHVPWGLPFADGLGQEVVDRVLEHS